MDITLSFQKMNAKCESVILKISWQTILSVSTILSDPTWNVGYIAKAKLIFSKPKTKTESTAYLIDVDGMADFGTIVCTNLIDDCSCQRSLTEWEKPEIDLWH